MNKLQEIRKAKGIKCTQAATKLGVSRNTLWNYENGRRTPSFSMLIKIATLYGVSVADFVDESKEIETAAENIEILPFGCDCSSIDNVGDISALDNITVQ